MSSYPPPINFLSIFNTQEFTYSSTGLTISTADLRYIKIAGGIASGLITFNAGLTSVGPLQITNTTQSTTPTNGALVVSGGLGVAKNCHFGGVIHISTGSQTNPSYSFIADLSTGMYRDSIAGDLLFSQSGVLRFGMSSSYVYSVLPHLFAQGSALSPGVAFNGSLTTGLYQPALNQLGITTGGNSRLIINSTAASFSVPIQLPTVGGTPSNFSYYEETSITSTWTYGNVSGVSTTVLITKYGRITTIFIQDMSAPLTNTNGSASRIVFNAKLPSRFYPQNSSNLNLPALINVNNTTIIVRAGILADGTIEFTQSSGAGFTSGQPVQVWACNFTITN